MWSIPLPRNMCIVNNALERYHALCCYVQKLDAERPAPESQQARAQGKNAYSDWQQCISVLVAYVISFMHEMNEEIPFFLMGQHHVPLPAHSQFFKIQRPARYYFNKLTSQKTFLPTTNSAILKAFLLELLVRCLTRVWLLYKCLAPSSSNNHRYLVHVENSATPNKSNLYKHHHCLHSIALATST